MKSKGLRKILAVIACSACLASGALAYNGFNASLLAKADEPAAATSVSFDDVFADFSENENVTFTKGQTKKALGSGVDFNGTLIEVTGSTTVTYDRVFNVKGFTYKNKNDNTPLIGLVPTPANAYTGSPLSATNTVVNSQIASGTLNLVNEFKNVSIVLTDAHDETNKLHIGFTFAPDMDTSPDGLYDNGKTYSNASVVVYGEKNGTVYGSEPGYNKGYGVRYGAVRQFSFMGYSKEAFRLVYDYDKNAVFGTLDGNKNPNVQNSYLLRMLGVAAKDYGNYDDPDNGGQYTAQTDDVKGNQQIWKGFTNGDVKMSISFTLENGVEKGNLIMTDFLGLDLTDSTVETFNVNETMNYSVDTIAEYSEAGDFTIPDITLKNHLISDYEKAYGENDVTVKYNDAEVATKKVGETYKLDKPGKYQFVYQIGERTHVLTTKVKANVKLKINGAASAVINGKVYNDGDVYQTDSDVIVKSDITSGWYKDEVTLVNESNDEAITFVDDANGISFNVENLYANNVLTITVRQKYVINYYVNGKLFDVKSINQGENAVLPSNVPSVNGYAFDRWVKDGNPFGADYNCVETGNYAAETINVNAYLIPINYTATLKIEDSFSSMATLTADTATFNIESGLGGFAKPTVTADGYVFAGWYYNGNLITKGSDLPTNDVTVYAYFTKAKKTITYKELNANGSYDVIDTSDVAIGEVSKAISVSKDGYVLEGWYLDAACNQKYNFGAELNDNVTLYANWVKVNDNTVTGVNDAGVNNSASVVNEVEISAFNLIDGLGIATMAISAVGLIGLIAAAVMIVLKLKK